MLFVLSGFANVLVLETQWNLLAFRIPNVIFSLLAGALLLILGSYGRFSGGLPPDNPYFQERHAHDPPEPADPAQPYPQSPEDRAATEEMTKAERAVAAGGGTPQQVERVHTVARYRTQEERRAAWKEMGRREKST